ncbi:MAG: CoA transferase, partial [Chloroflexi bacterium]|nr:CoA transferase [Chloroflexota bacterium]
SHGVTGPYTTKMFSDFGARVVKIERPDGGDYARRIGPFPGDVPNPEASGMFLDLNTGKESVTLDLKSAFGRNAVLQLAAQSDLVVESFRPGGLERLGLGYEALAAVNPRLVLVRISNFGQTGPYRDYQVDEMLAYAAGGAMLITGSPDREPAKMGAYVPLLLAGSVCAAISMSVVTGAELHGIGQAVDFSIVEALAGSMDRGATNLLAWQYSGDLMFRRSASRRGGILPTGAYPCADGFVHLNTQANWWGRLCRTIDRPDMIDDQYWLSNIYNVDMAGEFDAILYEFLLAHTKQEIMEKAQQEGLPISAINTIGDVFNDPHFRAREYFVLLDHPVAGPLEYPGPQFKLMGTPAHLRRAPLLGEHTIAVLTGDLGVPSEDLALLRSQGTI